MNEYHYRIELSQADYAAGLTQLMGELARHDTARQRMLFARLAAYVVILIIITIAFPQGGMAVFSAVLLFWLAEFVIRAAFKTQLVGISFEPEAHALTDVQFNDDGIVAVDELRTRRWAWDALRRIHLPQGYVVLEFIGWDMIVLPDRLWSSPEERAAFIAELTPKQAAPHSAPAIASSGDAVARLKLVEPVLIARLFLAVEVFQRIFDSFLPSGVRAGSNTAIVALIAACIGSGALWWASGQAFRWLAARSPSKALAVAWTVIVLMGTLFALWFFRVI